MNDYGTGDYSRDTAKYGIWVVIGGVVAIIVVLILAAMAVFGFGLFQRGTADFRGGTKAIEKTKGSGDFRIAAYDHFFNLCAAVQSDEASIDSLKEELNTNPSDGRKEQVQASMTALRSSRAEKINQYNADAHKDFTVGQFRDSQLPFTLDRNSEATTCTVP